MSFYTITVCKEEEPELYRALMDALMTGQMYEGCGINSVRQRGECCQNIAVFYLYEAGPPESEG